MGVDSANKYAINKLTLFYNIFILFGLLEIALIVYHAVLFFAFFQKTNSLNEQTDDISFLIFLVFHFISVLPAIAHLCQLAGANRNALEENKSRLQYVYFSNFLNILTWLYANLIAVGAVWSYRIHMQVKIFATLLCVYSGVVTVVAFSAYRAVNSIVAELLPAAAAASPAAPLAANEEVMV